ncbi:MAG: nucleotidyltransferase domain-containing protein [Nanoarchaeota archaeon]|nr:nucleotidyltransferase domain-containing protein [Nanoarchaeota archaeon]
MKSEIIKQIKKIEKEERVKVLFLMESGSRAWRWESEDSDYDIRGVYIQDYLVVNKPREQIDKKIKDLDITLWDLRKFLNLMMNSNPTVWEWLSSEIIYSDNRLRNELKRIFKKDFSPYKLQKHYISMARQNFHKYISEMGDLANLKRYVYVLRSVACVLWIEKYNTPPPKDYRKVINLLPKDIRNFFEKIVKDKKKSESLMGPRNKKIEGYITSFFDKNFDKDHSEFDLIEITKLFKRALNQKWKK